MTYADDLIEEAIVVAPTPQGEQAFRVTNPQKMRSKITTKAYHVFYDSKNYLIEDSYVVEKNCNDALNHLNNATSDPSEFTVSSDVTTIDSFRCVRKSLHEAIETVLERWGGHLVRDNFNIEVKETIGYDNGVTVRYKKNLKELTCEENWDLVVTKLLPVGKDGILLNGLDQTADLYVYGPVSYDLPYTKTVSFSQQDILEENYKNPDGTLNETAYKQALINDLRVQAQAYINKNCIPQLNYTLKAEMDQIIDIGDTIEVIDERFNFGLFTNVISYDYDCILKKYTELEFGVFKNRLSDLIHNITSTTINVLQTDEQSELDRKINALSQKETQDIQAVNESINALGNTLKHSIMTRSLSTSITNLAVDTYTIIPLDLNVSNDDKLSVTSDGGIEIGSGVSYVVVSGNMTIEPDIIGETYLKIVKNSYTNANTIGSSCIYSSVTGQNESLTIPPILTEVIEGDKIYLLYCTNSTNSRIIGNTYGSETSLTVETV